MIISRAGYQSRRSEECKSNKELFCKQSNHEIDLGKSGRIIASILYNLINVSALSLIRSNKPLKLHVRKSEQCKDCDKTDGYILKRKRLRVVVEQVLYMLRSPRILNEPHSCLYLSLIATTSLLWTKAG